MGLVSHFCLGVLPLLLNISLTIISSSLDLSAQIAPDILLSLMEPALISVQLEVIKLPQIFVSAVEKAESGMELCVSFHAQLANISILLPTFANALLH